MAKEPRVWLIRAWHGRWTNDFVENGYVGIGFNLDIVDMTQANSRDDVRRFFMLANPDITNDNSISQQSSHVSRFQFDVKPGDYVLTPGTKSRIFHYGILAHDDIYYTDGRDGLPCRNRRKVEWEPRILSGKSLPLGIRCTQGTVTEVHDPRKAAFLKLIR